MRITVALTISAVATALPIQRSQQTHSNLHTAETCHMGLRNSYGRMCDSYKTIISTDEYPKLDSQCLNVSWTDISKRAFDNTTHEVSRNYSWGNCVQWTTKDGYRYLSSNAVPDYYFDPYCPFGLGAGYCIANEPCPFPTLQCGVTKSRGYTANGDVWVPQLMQAKLPAVGNPTRSDRPGDMYSSVDEGECNVGAATGFHLNGISIQGPNDAGAVNVDEAGFQLMCGGHVTPPVSAPPDGRIQGAVPDIAPLYHYHKAADCTAPFKEESIPVSHGGRQDVHGSLIGYALDGFGIYAYSDVGGAAPILDECGGHFGAIDSQLDVVYHYHATTYCPYHLACQGPALGKCESTQNGVSFCGKGCGAEVCIQPNTDKAKLTTYLGRWNSSWLEHFTHNDF